MKKRAVIYVSLLFVLGVHLIHPSDGISYKSLEEVVSRSECIVIVEKANPAYTRKEIDLAPSGKKSTSENRKYIFTYIIYHFFVAEVLYAEEGVKVTAGTKIDINPYKLGAEINRKKASFIGVRVGILYDSLQESISSSDHDKMIVFLDTTDNVSFSFTVYDACVSIELREKITELIGKVGKR